MGNQFMYNVECVEVRRASVGVCHNLPCNEIQYNTIQYIHIAKLAMLAAVQDIHRVPRAPPEYNTDNTGQEYEKIGREGKGGGKAESARATPDNAAHTGLPAATTPTDSGGHKTSSKGLPRGSSRGARVATPPSAQGPPSPGAVTHTAARPSDTCARTAARAHSRPTPSPQR